MRNLCSTLNSRFLTLGIMLASMSLFAQTTISTGSIQGTITDPSGAVVGGARITITNKATRQSIVTSTSSSGTYASGALTPAEYQLQIEGKGFKTVQVSITVQVNTTASGNVALPVGQAAETVQVEGSALSVNTEQATVQGVLTAQQIENLPINGRLHTHGEAWGLGVQNADQAGRPLILQVNGPPSTQKNMSFRWLSSGQNKLQASSERYLIIAERVAGFPP